jgi:hypothetical protein
MIESNSDVRLAVGLGREDEFVLVEQSWIFNLNLDFGGDVLGDAIGEDELGHDGLRVASRGEFEIGGENNQLFDGRWS